MSNRSGSIKSGIFFVLAVSITILSFAVGCTSKKSNEILIGQFASLTGSEATFGISTDEGVRMVIDEVNEKGGIKGRKIKLITLDDQGKPEEAASVVTRLIEQHKVVALIGEVASTRSLAAAPIAQAKKIPMISPSSTNPQVTEVGDYIFRVCFIDPFQGEVMARFVIDHLKLKKVAVLRDLKSDYSVGLANFFIKKFKELGGEVLADLSYQAGDVDFKAQLTQIKSLNPEGLYIPGYYTDVGLIARQARELGIKVPLLGGDGWDSSKLFEIGGSAVENSYFSNHYSNESDDPLVKDFVKRYQEKYKKTPDGLAAQGYDAAKILVHVLESIDEITPQKIRDGLAQVKNFKGVTGVITIDEKRNAAKGAVIVQVKGQTNKYVTTINP
ncbi:MAG: ABC transporter substrate-binding protein [Pseudobdellovibrionaceae bacterium]|nr:ABC transporter substrate-binding protein [Pseudobdellovibrionaceae bacterium]